MRVLAHRGWWQDTREQNTTVAFQRAIEAGFGIETDIRDQRGTLVISHNMAQDACPKLDDLFSLLESNKRNPPFALNVKADGLQEELARAVRRHSVRDYFVFDMSVPEALRYLRHGISTFTRQSEYETVPAYYDLADGIWVDWFTGDFSSLEILQQHIDHRKRMVFVSPELHGRDHTGFWRWLKQVPVDTSEMMICTDYPLKAVEFFNEQD